MKNKELISKLLTFNMDAEIEILHNFIPYDLEIYGWNSGDSDNLSLSESKSRTNRIYLGGVGCNKTEESL